jgi:hypothetical protein
MTDILVVIFKDKESKQPISAELFKSEFNRKRKAPALFLPAGTDIFVVVQPVDTTISGSDKLHYKFAFLLPLLFIMIFRISFLVKDTVPAFGPPIPHPGVFERTPQLRDFLLTKSKITFVIIKLAFSLLTKNPYEHQLTLCSDQWGEGSYPRVPCLLQTHRCSTQDSTGSNGKRMGPKEVTILVTTVGISVNTTSHSLY